MSVLLYMEKWHQVFMTVGDTRKGHFPKLVRESLVRRVVWHFSKVWVEASETKIETLDPQFCLLEIVRTLCSVPTTK